MTEADFPSEEDDREAWEVAERAAEYRAIPIRSITKLIFEGKVAVLDCGHVNPLQTRLLVGDTARCLLCYEEGMREAQEMIERDCG